MPRLPDLDSLGARPVPVSRRSIASNPRAGAVGSALAGLGDRIAQTGQRMLASDREKEDKLAYASARAAFLKADIETRKQLAADPDYGTWEQRYGERMAAARSEAAKLIRSSNDRALFEQDAQLDVLRGSAELAKGAFARRSDAEVGSAQDRLFELQDAAQDALDDASREAIIGNASDLIGGLQSKGYISAEQAGKMRRDWTGNYVLQRIETLRNAEDFEGAQRFFEANRGRLDQATESRVQSLLTDALNNREALQLGDYFVEGAVPEAPPEQGISMSAMVAITAQSESGNRERDDAGRLITSRAGAQGRMQVMPATARNPGHGIRPWDGKTDEDRSRVGEELLAALMRKYANDPAKAWAAYNWGEGRVDDAVRKYGAKWLDHAPAETRAYVRKNVAALGSGGPAGDGQGVLRHDLRRINADIDTVADREGWTPEKRERVKTAAARRVQRDDALLDREQADAYEAALAKAEVLGPNFTDPSQLGDAYYRASEIQQRTLRNMAEANVAASIKPVAANGAEAMTLNLMRFYDPEGFKQIDLRTYAGRVTPAEMDTLLQQQARSRTDEGKWSPQTGIVSALSYGKKINEMDLDGEDEAAILRIMEAEAWRLYEANGKKPLTRNDYSELFRSATRTVRTTTSFLGFRTGTNERPRYELTLDMMPAATRQRLTRQLEQNGLAVNDENLLRLYRLDTR